MVEQLKMLTAAEKQVWLDELRSGDYRQGKGALCTIDDEGGVAWCCLGVGADVLIDGWWETRRAGSATSWLARLVSPTGVIEKPLTIALEGRIGPMHAAALASMNDAGQPFSEIADWIEDNIRTVEVEA